jgi:hypothetical protein
MDLCILGTLQEPICLLTAMHGFKGLKAKMFFLSVDCLISAVDDLSRQELEGPAEVMRKAIARAEALDPEKEALFIIQDKEHLALVHYNREKSASKLTIT